jgi:hypothetical protein
MSTEAIAAVVGVAGGFIQMTGMTSYVYSTFKGAKEFTTEELSMLITIIANAPTAILAMKGGFGTCRQLLLDLADSLQFFAKGIHINLSPRQAQLLVAYSTSAAILSAASWFSSKTSETLAEDMPPPPGVLECLDQFIHFSIRYGTIGFNALWSSHAAKKLCEYKLKAYETDPKLLWMYLITQGVEWVRSSAPTKELAALAQAHEVGMFGARNPRRVVALESVRVEGGYQPLADGVQDEAQRSVVAVARPTRSGKR